MSHPGTLIQSSVNDNICCQFVVCETCLWSATIFRYVVKQNNNGNFQTCPICSVPNILLISITNEGVIFNSSLIRYNQEKYLLD